MLATLILLLTLLITALAPAATPSSYFPLVPGATWTRKAEDGAVITARVTETKSVGKVQCTVIETRTVRENRERTTRICYQVADNGIFVLETAVGPRTTVLTPPRPFALLPPAAGTTWSWRTKGPNVDIIVADRWVREETVRVSAGTFRAWKMESVTRRGSLTLRVVTWFAPGVGIVKIAREARGEGQEQEGSSELISYKIP